MFTINDNCQFRIQFENGWAVSVGCGPTHYCAAKNFDKDFRAPMKERFWESNTAEIAIIPPHGGVFHRLDGWDDDAHGHVSPDELLKVMNEVANY